MTPILVVTEQRQGSWNRMSWETMAAATALAGELQAEVAAVAIGDGLEAAAAEVASRGVAQVFALDHPLLASYTPDAYVAALEQLVRAETPRFVFFPHTYQVRDYAPKLATRFGQVLISDAVGQRVEAGQPVFVRQLFQGKINCEVRATGDGPCFVSIQAGAFRAAPAASDVTAGQVKNVDLALEEKQIRSRPEAPFREAERAVDLTAADIIVSVGRGIQEKENLALVEELATALGAELAASRPICDNGWMPMERQIGSSGQTVAPKVYLAVGISGAIQHMVGMKGAKTIIAINKDPDAPIFEIADYGIVGDLFEVIPALTEAVKKAKGR